VASRPCTDILALSRAMLVKYSSNEMLTWAWLVEISKEKVRLFF